MGWSGVPTVRSASVCVIFVLLSYFNGICVSRLCAREPASTSTSHTPILPEYASEQKDLSRFSLFANSGWDGNWYVGTNTCWVQKLSLPENRGFVRAYVGAKLGRMKTSHTDAAARGVKKALSGKLLIAHSTTSGFVGAQSMTLADTDAIPFEGDSQVALEGTGEAAWFWAAVPVHTLSFGKDVFVRLWAEGSALTDATHAPILAAAWGDDSEDSWLISGSSFSAPSGTLGERKLITQFDPAIVIKLIPPNSYTVNVGMTIERASGRYGDEIIIAAFLAGVNIDRAWVEYAQSQDSGDWKACSPSRWQAPYQFTLDASNAPRGTYRLRVSALDELGNQGSSTPVEITSK